MGHLTNDFDFNSKVKGFDWQGSVHSFNVGLSFVGQIPSFAGALPGQLL